MVKALKISVTLLLVSIVGIIIYQWLSPKVIVINHSNIVYDQLVIKMPKSRISFAPILAKQTETIYYSFQNSSGVVIYQLYREGQIVTAGALNYDGRSELTKTIEFNIKLHHKIEVNER